MLRLGVPAFTPPNPPAWPARPALLLGLWLAAPVPALSLETTVDFRDSRQTAHSASETFTTYFRRESVTVRQTKRLSSPLTLSLRFRLLRETGGGDAGGTNQESRRRIYQPDASLRYQRGRLSAGVKGNWLERRAEGATTLAPEATRKQIAGWLNSPLPFGGNLTSNLTRTVSEEEGLITAASEQRQTTGFLVAEQPLGSTWRAQYELSGNSNDLISRDTRRTFVTNSFELRGNPSFVDGRLDTWFRGRSQLSSQKVEVGISGKRTLLRTPLSGGVTLDDTPETLDPLEEDPIFVPTLYDGDLETATTIRIGDSAPPVREFGGDYRNIQVDFGSIQNFDSAVLYVDERLINPELFEWLVFVTDDPEGRVWEELGRDRATVGYNEFGTVLQGWEVRFAEGVTGRFLKVVDVKLGPTIPELRVTELEVFTREDVERQKTTERSQDHRVEARLGYDLTRALRVGYETRLRTRIFEDASRDVDEANHGFRSAYAFESYLLRGQLDLHTVSSEIGRNTDAKTYQLSASRRQQHRLSGTLTWSRTEDRGSGRDLTTDNYSLATNWQAAPRLRVTQQLAHGRRRDDVFDLQSRSFVVTTRVRSTPFASLSVNAHRTDRWVDQQAGSGFESFNDSGLDMFWAPVPLVQLTSNSRHQRRDTSEWDTRQGLTWTPFPGGKLETVISGDTYYDSRVDNWQLGAGVNLRWRPRPGFLAEGRIEVRRFQLAGVETTPVSSHVHLSWSR